MSDDGRRYPGWAPGMELREDWLALTPEEILEPDREIVDPHHHLWVHGSGDALAVYEMDALARDTGAGHNVVQTMFMECRSYYDMDAPEHLRSVGETRTVAQMAAQDRGPARIAGIVGNVDLTQEPALIDAALAAHEAAGQGLFKGIRHAGARDSEPERLIIPGRGLANQYARPDFRRGVALLGQRGLTYDTWHYHHQMRDFIDLARAVPETVLVLDHLGTPLGRGRFAGRRDEIFDVWKQDMVDLAACDNVRLKLGGLNMPDNGWGWHERGTPPSSDELMACQAKWYIHALDLFGAGRCMFESNFPVDRASVSYTVLWNFFKKIASGASEAEKAALFAGTARSVYGLPPA